MAACGVKNSEMEMSRKMLDKCKSVYYTITCA